MVRQLTGRWVTGWIVIALLATHFPVWVSAQDEVQPLPPVQIDALDPNAFSVSNVPVAAGQLLKVTNRGVLAHTFVVPEWGISMDLPTLETVDIPVPDNVQIGETYTFYCDEPGHRELGQEGVLTIVSVEDARAAALLTGQDTSDLLPSTEITTQDNFSFSPDIVEAQPGQIIQVRNDGALEHHFVVDEWNLNETISPGEVKLITVPAEAQPGQNLTFYCSVPGHQASGMQGTISIVEARLTSGSEGDNTNLSNRLGATALARFVPQPTILGTEWAQVRAGNAQAVLPDDQQINPQIFPGEGRSASFVGPAGSRATVVVLPFNPRGIPENQVDDAIRNVQLAMLTDWETNLVSNDSKFDKREPPVGCDAASWIEGVTSVYTLPGGSTVCQLRSSGVIIFVAVEGDLDGKQSVDAADEIIVRVLNVEVPAEPAPTGGSKQD